MKEGEPWGAHTQGAARCQRQRPRRSACQTALRVALERPQHGALPWMEVSA
jgi:hypothetical protein